MIPFERGVCHFDDVLTLSVMTDRTFLNPGQGLTQTFMSSGPQDHQLRRSGGPTIFLVVLTTTNVTHTWKS